MAEMIEPNGQGVLMGQSLDHAIMQGHALIEQAIEQYKPAAVFGLFSGGNDSMTMLDLALPYVDAALHVRTGIGIPQTYEWAKETAGRMTEWQELVTPPDTYRNLVLKYGFPGPLDHLLMYRYLKDDALNKFRDSILPLRNQRVLFLSGMRAFESRKRAKRIHKPLRREGRIVWCDPIMHFDSRLMSEYQERFKLPRSPVTALLHKSGECLCGAYARKGEIKEIECWFPDVAAEIHGLEAEVKATGNPRCTWGAGERKGDMKPPGPLCSGCSLFE